MASAQETFRNTVIAPLQVNIGTSVLSYAEYLRLPAHQRSNDEADVVDSKFTQKVLEWLGYDGGSIIYNRPLAGSPANKPDFVVKMLGATAFLVEDKSTDERFDEASVKQLRRYNAGTSGYSLWTNARTILGLRFDANGHYQTLVEVRVEGVFGPHTLPFSQEANFELLYLLFHKQRFTNTVMLINEIAIGTEAWEKGAKPLTDDLSLKAFIAESRTVLDQLTTAIKAQLTSVTIEIEEAMSDFTSSRLRYAVIVQELIEKLRGGVSNDKLHELETALLSFQPVLTDIDITQIERLKPLMGAATATSWNIRVQEISGLITALRERELARVESRRVRGAYLLWRERYKVIEGEDDKNEMEAEMRRQTAFAEQVSYVFFVRLLLTRVLEDKGIMPHLVSDGGFAAWYEFLKGYGIENVGEIGGESFLPIVYRRVSTFYRHFFLQPVFDWFLPDDYLLALVLHRLSKYNFKDVSSDLLGFTYEAFIDRVARNKKGHFLTPPTVVEFMLDRAGYTGSAVIGESLLDTACGSGSFLIHAARRLRQALVDTVRDPIQVGRHFIEQVQANLVGLEVNPFSCYLAELNLFIQVLDDLVLLWKRGERPNIDRFAIYNSNSLEMSQAVLHSEQNTTATTFTNEDASLDEAAPIKVRRATFSYVICNPPYVNRGIILDTKSYGRYPFYRGVVKGDENFYLLFLRLAAYYISPGGTICIICPLNLLGDESTMSARDLFSQPEWSIQSLTRFYARDILFPGVLQGVCIIRIDNLPRQVQDNIEIRGGFSLEDAARTTTEVQRGRVISSYPVKATWSKPWLVNAQAEMYDLWEYVRDNAEQELADLLFEKMTAAKGDARSTWAKPMLVSGPGVQRVPLTKGKQIVDWGGWSAFAYLDPTIPMPTTIKDYTGSRWVQRQVQRIANLKQQETALFLKEVSGLEMKRPIRGTILQRNGQHPVAADETVLVLYTLHPAHEELAYAVFGLVTSTVFNFFFSLFSTNAHANFKEILRLPVPIWSPERQKQLANETRTVLTAYKDLHSHEQMYGEDATEHVVASSVLTASRLPTLRFEDLVVRGDVVIGPSNYTLDVLLNRGNITFNPRLSNDTKQAIEHILRANGQLTYQKGGKDLLVPNPRVASAFLAQLHTTELERETSIQAVTIAQKALDDMIMDAYGITNLAWRDAITVGVPWARG